MSERCGKCESPKDNPSVLVPHAVCDLAPMAGYSGPCMLKFESGNIDLDDGKDGASVVGRKKGRPNGKRSDRKPQGA